MNNCYNKINKHSLKGELLIMIRNEYIELISKYYLDNKIIPIEYIDNKIHLETINRKSNILNNDTIIINDTLRIEFIRTLLSKELIKGTSKLINTLSYL